MRAYKNKPFINVTYLKYFIQILTIYYPKVCRALATTFREHPKIRYTLAMTFRECPKTSCNLQQTFGKLRKPLGVCSEV
ncbi:hypothetical protein [Chryseobacterium taeanense]|uniref:hypothetical protein n=1 Tax=Chryseobacterium taeanense TaxID=311334 RepID=UPI00111416EC|nr:hypothetical protein [Chryseobacterium taeanense]